MTDRKFYRTADAVLADTEIVDPYVYNVVLEAVERGYNLALIESLEVD